MNGWWRRVAIALVTVLTIVLGYTLVFSVGMARLEDEPISFAQSAQVVVESLTTAGYGGYAPWESSLMNGLVLAMNLTGVLLVFIGLPLFAIPLFRQALETAPPESSPLADHVVICSYTQSEEILSQQLDRAGIPHLFIDREADTVSELIETGHNAIRGNPEEVETLQAANVADARALVADVSDQTNPTVILSARQLSEDIPIISVIRREEVGSYHQLAGADNIVQSRQVLGNDLGRRSLSSIAERLEAAIEVDTEVEITEFLVEEGSPLVGDTLRESSTFDRMDLTVIGAWIGGKFVVSPDPDTVISENMILLVAGEYESLGPLNARPLPDPSQRDTRVVVCGYGTVGQAAAETVAAAGYEATTVDIEPMDGVDIVGDITEVETLREAGVQDARAVVLSLNDDIPTIYATLVINQLAPEVEVIARANSPDTVWKLYNAGADFVLSLATVTGEIIASEVIGDRTALTPQTGFDFTRLSATSIAGQTLSELDIRAQTGATVVAVEREGQLITDLGGHFTVRSDDTLIVAGTDEAVERLRPLLG